MENLNWDRVNEIVDKVRKALTHDPKSFEELKTETQLSDTELCIGLGYVMGKYTIGVGDSHFQKVDLYEFRSVVPNLAYTHP